MNQTDIQGRDTAWREDLRKAMTAKERAEIPRVEMPMLDGDYRVTCNEEVNQGLASSRLNSRLLVVLIVPIRHALRVAL